MTLPLWPPAASGYASELDLMFVLLALPVTALSAPVFVLLVVFAARYRQGNPANRVHPPNRNVKLEISWALIPFALTLVFFVWAAKLYFDDLRPPAGALEIDVVARQWMWKFQHPGGQREINQLHVPAGEPVKLTMISEDVIHSLYLPALRLKHDVLPGRYEQLWFTADQPGTYHLLCAEFCGTSHSQMGGSFIVMPPADYAAWLDNMPDSRSLASAGKALFSDFGCSGCHGASSKVQAPSLAGVFGSPVPLASGEIKIADESYLRDSILLPRKDVAAGYQPIMPSFKDRISEGQLLQLIAYIESLGDAEGMSR
jgi:cytochrome c oxidase subunit II